MSPPRKQMGDLMFPNLKNDKSATRTLQLTEATVSASQDYIFFPSIPVYTVFIRVRLIPSVAPAPQFEN